MHADSVQTVINRLENDPINVPRAMIQSLDILSIQTISHSGGERVRRSREVAEIVGIDQRTGDLDYQNIFSWNPSDDEFSSSIGQSKVLAEIREEHGWSQLQLQRELRNRKRVLKYASEMDITDFQTFTAIVNEYYADPEGVLERVETDVDEEAMAEIQ